MEDNSLMMLELLDCDEYNNDATHDHGVASWGSVTAIPLNQGWVHSAEKSCIVNVNEQVQPYA